MRTLSALAFVVWVGGCGKHTGETATPVAKPSSAPRSVEAIRRDGNHLVGSRSVYLQEHAHNPVDWYSWSPEALARARDEGKPIFLSIGYSACHWCHVMAAEVFENDEVATWLNAHFVSIKVDREERPDLDEAYMASLQAMTGSGGWPMTLFLTPALKPFFGATYLPRDRFLTIAKKGWERFSSSPGDVDKDAAEVQESLARAADEELRQGGNAPLPLDEVSAIATSAIDRIDLDLGGFRGGQKFPVPVKWSFLLHATRKWGSPPLKSAVRGTLDAMALGGIRDPIGGGFHRYSTDPRWDVPHFEKMLYDNAQLASLYLEAGAALGERRYIDVATDTLDFLVREMQRDGGGFEASFDADSGGREGAYYVWSTDELVEALGGTDGPVVAHLLGVSPGAGRFEGASAVNRRASIADAARDSKRTVADVTAAWSRARPLLATARESRPHPRADTKIVTAWNGLVISALAEGFRATGDVRYRDAAVRAADFLWTANRTPQGALLRSTAEGQPGAPAVLEDHAFLACGLIALFEATGDRVYVERAIGLVKDADARFAAPGGGWLGSQEGSTPFARTLSLDDSVEPSGGAALLHAAIALASLTLEADLGAMVDRALAGRANVVRQRGMGSAGWLDATLLRAGPFYDVVIAGDGEAGNGLAHVFEELDPGWGVVVRVPAGGPDTGLTKLLGATEGKTSGGAAAKAFVCTQGACKAPTSDPRALRAGLLEGWQL